MRTDYRSQRDMTSSFLFKTNNPDFNRRNNRRMNRYGEIEISCYRMGNRKYHSEGYWNTLSEQMHRSFMHLDTSSNALSSEMSYFTFRYKDGDASIVLRKDGSKWYMNGVKKNQKDVAIALAKVIAYGAQNRSRRNMVEYIERNITYSGNVLHALENRTPYWFYKDGRQIKVKINTKLIGREDIAFEISENVWASTNLNDANVFIDCYKNGASRSKKWANISPSNLWFNMFGSHASESELQLMTAWLLQNRTDVIVEERAFELLQNMDSTYDAITLVNVNSPVFQPDKLGGLSKTLDFGLCVHGELGDWLVYPNGYTSGTQRCSSVFYGNDGKISGPFCIDDINGKNVVGDQIATRAMLLKNDKMALQMVSTLREIKSTRYRLNKRLVEKAKYQGKPNMRGERR